MCVLVCGSVSDKVDGICCGVGFENRVQPNECVRVQFMIIYSIYLIIAMFCEWIICLCCVSVLLIAFSVSLVVVLSTVYLCLSTRTLLSVSGVVFDFRIGYDSMCSDLL